MEQLLQKCEVYFAPAGRILVGAFFVLAGISKLMDVAGTAGYIEAMGLPASTLLAVLALIVEIGAGGALIIGYKAKYAAVLLAAFVLIVSFPFHGPKMWADNPMQQILFMKNLAIMGALLFMSVHLKK